jgi:hypothetical protein
MSSRDDLLAAKVLGQLLAKQGISQLQLDILVLSQY